MPEQANKCTQCGSVQNWERYLGFSGTILGLLVALISVLTFALPIWSGLIIPRAARPSAVLVEVDDSGRATFTVSNGGTAPAAIEQIVVGRGDGVAEFDLGGLPGSERVVQPNDVRIFNARLHVTNEAEDVRHLASMIRANSKCPTAIWVVTPAGSRETARVVTTTPAEEDPDEPGCGFKLRKLFLTTLIHRCSDPAFEAALLKAEAAPRAVPGPSLHCPLAGKPDRPENRASDDSGGPPVEAAPGGR
jgi:hypothetical protein